MVKFEFTVTDEEASLIMDCMNDARLRLFEGAVLGIAEGVDHAQVEWMKNHSQLIAVLITKMSNKRV